MGHRKYLLQALLSFVSFALLFPFFLRGSLTCASHYHSLTPQNPESLYSCSSCAKGSKGKVSRRTLCPRFIPQGKLEKIYKSQKLLLIKQDLCQHPSCTIPEHSAMKWAGAVPAASKGGCQCLSRSRRLCPGFYISFFFSVPLQTGLSCKQVPSAGSARAFLCTYFMLIGL